MKKIIYIFLKGKIYNKNRIIFHNKELEKNSKIYKIRVKIYKRFNYNLFKIRY